MINIFILLTCITIFTHYINVFQFQSKTFKIDNFSHQNFVSCFTQKCPRELVLYTECLEPCQILFYQKNFTSGIIRCSAYPKRIYRNYMTGLDNKTCEDNLVFFKSLKYYLILTAS